VKNVPKPGKSLITRRSVVRIRSPLLNVNQSPSGSGFCLPRACGAKTAFIGADFCTVANVFDASIKFFILAGLVLSEAFKKWGNEASGNKLDKISEFRVNYFNNSITFLFSFWFLTLLT
jgi:hypothetical protein